MDEMFFIFDLDDTLYSESQYSFSALAFVAGEIENLFGFSNVRNELVASFEKGSRDAIGEFWKSRALPLDGLHPLLLRMQSHEPDISLYPDVQEFLGEISRRGLPFAIVTDGRSCTHRAKIKQLALGEAVAICISEETGATKPDARAFEPIMSMVTNKPVVFVGDNPTKDFLFPNSQDWTTVMRRDDGTNIREQTLPENPDYHPMTVIDSFVELREQFL